MTTLLSMVRLYLKHVFLSYLRQFFITCDVLTLLLVE